MALKADGTVWGWGRDDSGQVGEASSPAFQRPAPIAGLSNVVTLAAGVSHGLALRSDGTVWTWGANDFGQLGDGTTINRSVPAPVEGLSNAVAVAAGNRFGLALTGDGTVWAWGDNNSGQLGDGTPVTVTNQTFRTNIVTVVTYLTVTNYTRQTNYNHVTRQVVVTNSWPITTWMEYHYLDVVDYAIPSNPAVRSPVNIPGALQGLSHQGALLYTLARRPATEASNEWGQWVDAVAYDGVEAHQVDSLRLPDRYPTPIMVRDATIFVATPALDTNSSPQLESWALSPAGRFSKLSGFALGSPAQNITAFGDLLVTQHSDKVQLFRVSDPSRLALIGGGGPTSCLGYNLEHADGAAARGLWLPLGFYGVHYVPLTQNPSAP